MTTRQNPDLDKGANEEVIDYILKLDRAIKSGDAAVDEDSLQFLYERRFRQLTDELKYGYDSNGKVFRSWPWIDDPKIQALTHLHPKTLALYSFQCCKFLFTDKHAVALSATRAWDTFCSMVDVLLAPAEVRPTAASYSNGIMWDIFDEMVFQLSQVYQKRLNKKKDVQKVWNVATVCEKLQTVVEQAGTLEDLKQVASGVIPPSILLSPTNNHQRSAAGLFSIITLMRVDVLLGDFQGALRRLEPLSVPIFGRRYFGGEGVEGAAPAHIALYYHIGFCYLMLRRYEDAANNFRVCLAVKAKSRRYSDKVQAEAASLYSIVCILANIPMEDVGGLIDDRLRANFEDEVRQLAAGQHEKFREVFSRTSPKFLTIPIAGTFADNTVQEGKEVQTRMFMREVMQHIHIIALRGYFHVYRTISTEKIDSLLSAHDDGEKIDGHAVLLSMKHKSKQLVHDGKSANLLAGTYRASASVALAIDGDSVQLIALGADSTIEEKYVRRIEDLDIRLAKWDQ